MKQKLLIWVALVVITLIISLTYSWLSRGHLHIAGTIGFMIGGGIVAIELFVIQAPVGAPLRRLPLAVFVALSTLLWLVIIYAGLQIGPRLYGMVPYGADYTATTLRQDMLFAVGIAFVLNAAMRVQTLVGARVLWNFLIGRYYRPVREDRIFMFLDLADSTRLSEELGDLRVQALLREFFADVAEPVMAYGGETHRYIGDEVVVIWPLTGTAADQACMECVFAIRARIHKRTPFYQQRFGVVPRFRVGLHGGPVVAGEVGQDKREIVYFGDTVNTAARLASACKQTGSEVLVSEPLAHAAGLPALVHAQPVAPLELAGKHEPFRALALTRVDGQSVAREDRSRS